MDIAKLQFLLFVNRFLEEDYDLITDLALGTNTQTTLINYFLAIF